MSLRDNVAADVSNLCNHLFQLYGVKNAGVRRRRIHFAINALNRSSQGAIRCSEVSQKLTSIVEKFAVQGNEKQAARLQVCQDAFEQNYDQSGEYHHLCLLSTLCALLSNDAPDGTEAPKVAATPIAAEEGPFDLVHGFSGPHWEFEPDESDEEDRSVDEFETPSFPTTDDEEQPELPDTLVKPHVSHPTFLVQKGLNQIHKSQYWSVEGPTNETNWCIEILLLPIGRSVVDPTSVLSTLPPMTHCSPRALEAVAGSVSQETSCIRHLRRLCSTSQKSVTYQLFTHELDRALGQFEVTVDGMVMLAMKSPPSLIEVIHQLNKQITRFAWLSRLIEKAGLENPDHLEITFLDVLFEELSRPCASRRKEMVDWLSHLTKPALLYFARAIFGFMESGTNCPTHAIDWITSPTIGKVLQSLPFYTAAVKTEIRESAEIAESFRTAFDGESALDAAMLKEFEHCNPFSLPGREMFEGLCLQIHRDQNARLKGSLFYQNQLKEHIETISTTYLLTPSECLDELANIRQILHDSSARNARSTLSRALANADSKLLASTRWSLAVNDEMQSQSVFGFALKYNLPDVCYQAVPDHTVGLYMGMFDFLTRLRMQLRYIEDLARLPRREVLPTAFLRVQAMLLVFLQTTLSWTALVAEDHRDTFLKTLSEEGNVKSLHSHISGDLQMLESRLLFTDYPGAKQKLTRLLRLIDQWILTHSEDAHDHGTRSTRYALIRRDDQKPTIQSSDEPAPRVIPDWPNEVKRSINNYLAELQSVPNDNYDEVMCIYTEELGLAFQAMQPN